MLTHHQILALGFLPGITSAALRALIECGAELDEIIHAPADDLAAMGLRRAAIIAITDISPYLERATWQVEGAKRFGARIVQFHDDDYPALLREIYAPPISLYIIGELTEEDARSIAIVGTRSASSYGREGAEQYAGRFAQAGVTVVSGLARGIDTYAHAAALKGGGRTIAVVASGLDQIQPYAAALLARSIVARGAVISEYPFGVKALRPYFPQRNRIISGMSSGVVVVESDEKGGGMITAGFALDQNRDVFALPGPITSSQSRGANLLIRTDRARLTQSPNDVLDALGFHYSLPEAGPVNNRPGELSLFEQRIYDILDIEPLHVDIICDAAGLAPSEALVSLLSLEFKGLVRQIAGKRFRKS